MMFAAFAKVMAAFFAAMVKVLAAWLWIWWLFALTVLWLAFAYLGVVGGLAAAGLVGLLMFLHSHGSIFATPLPRVPIGGLPGKPRAPVRPGPPPRRPKP
jgi:hypothetical protein